MSLVTPQHVGSSRIGDQTHVPCTGRRILNHWMTREVWKWNIWFHFDPWVGKIPWRRVWQPTPVFLPGESHGQSLEGYSPWGRKESDTTEQLTDAHKITSSTLASQWSLFSLTSGQFHSWLPFCYAFPHLVIPSQVSLWFFKYSAQVLLSQRESQGPCGFSDIGQ